MQKCSIQLCAALLTIVSVAVLVYIFGFSRQTEPPMFVIYDDETPGEALAIYLDSRVLKKHNVSAEKFEVAFRAFPVFIAEAMGNAWDEAFSGPSEGKRDQEAAQYELRFGLTLVAFREICKNGSNGGLVSQCRWHTYSEKNVALEGKHVAESECFTRREIVRRTV